MKVDFFEKQGLWLFGVLALVHLMTLSLHPLPWFDEVFFADVSDSFSRFGRFDLKMAPNVYKQEILFYGPVYFSLQALIIKLFGLQAFSFRMLNFVSGLGLAWLVGRYLHSRKIQAGFIAMAPVLMLADPVFGQNMHSGRMDLTAVFLAFWGFSLAFTNEKELPSLKRSAWVGLIWAMAFLTTPRIVFVLLPGFLLFFFRQKFSIPWRPFLVLCLAFLIPVFAWIFGKVGGLTAYFAQFSHNNLSHHIGPQGNGFQWIRYYLYLPYYLGLLAVAVDMAFAWNISKKADPISLFCLAVAALFHVLVVEMGPYSAMVLPFYVVLILSHPWHIPLMVQRWIRPLPLLLLLGFSGLFLTKSGIILLSRQSRNDQVADAFIAQADLKGKKIVSSFEYYYALHRAGAQYYAYELALAMSDRLRFHFDTLQFDYLLLNQRDMRGHQRLEYENLNRMERLKELNVPETFLPLQSLLPQETFQRLPAMNGTLYRRIR